MSEDEQTEGPKAPRTRLIVPEGVEKPKSRLIAPAVGEAEAAAEAASEPAVEVTPLTQAETEVVAPADAAEEEDEGIGEAERGEFTVINEDTGETHSVPVRISAMSPPPEEATVATVEEVPPEEPVYAEPEPEPQPKPQPEYVEQAAPQVYVEEPAPVEVQPEQVYEQPHVGYLEPQLSQPQAQPQGQEPQQFYDPATGYPVEAQQQVVPQPPPQPQLPFAGLQLPAQRGIPSWALLLIGLLAGFLTALVLFKFTEFGPMIRPLGDM